MKSFFTKLLSLALALALCVSLAGAAPGVTVQGDAVSFSDALPFVDENDRTLVPLRAVADALGLTVQWNGAQRTVTFTKDWTAETAPIRQDNDQDGIAESYPVHREVVFYIGSRQYEVRSDQWYGYDAKTGQMQQLVSGGWVMEMDTAAVILDNRAYAPIRYLAACFYYDVLWENGQVHLISYEPISYHCQHSLADGQLTVTVQNTQGLSSAQITSIEIAKGDAALVEVPFLPLSRSALPTELTPGLLAGAAVQVVFQSGETFHVVVHFTAVKSNGAATDASCRFSFQAQTLEAGSGG